MVIVNYLDNPKIKKDIKPLFISAFPMEERPPVNMYFASFKRDNNFLFGFYDNNQFIGFTSTKTLKDVCYIFFLAVKEEYRNQGYGSKILNELKKMYKDYVLLLCYEEVDEKYEDYPNRVKREQFYQKNGFKRNPLVTEEFGVTYQTAVCGSRYVTFEEYKDIYVSGFSDYALKFLKQVK